MWNGSIAGAGPLLDPAPLPAAQRDTSVPLLLNPQRCRRRNRAGRPGSWALGLPESIRMGRRTCSRSHRACHRHLVDGRSNRRPGEFVLVLGFRFWAGLAGLG